MQETLTAIKGKQKQKPKNTEMDFRKKKKVNCFKRAC